MGAPTVAADTEVTDRQERSIFLFYQCLNTCLVLAFRCYCIEISFFHVRDFSPWWECCTSGTRVYLSQVMGWRVTMLPGAWTLKSYFEVNPAERCRLSRDLPGIWKGLPKRDNGSQEDVVSNIQRYAVKNRYAAVESVRKQGKLGVCLVRRAADYKEEGISWATGKAVSILHEALHIHHCPKTKSVSLVKRASGWR